LKKNIYIALIFFLFLFQSLHSGEKHLKYIAKSGDGITIVLNKFFIPSSQDYIAKFKELNSKKFDKEGGMFKGMSYILPIKIFNYDGKSLASSLKSLSEEEITKIELYNKKVFSGGLKSHSFKKDKKIWVPFFISSNNLNIPDTEVKKTENGKTSKLEKAEKKEKTPKLPLSDKKKQDKLLKKEKNSQNKFDSFKSGKNTYPIFGKKLAKVSIKSSVLKGHVFYIDPGHGGPDPGAIGHRNGHELHEDEYAYDVSLRLVRFLIEKGAKVYVIVIDNNDGIRDDEYLKPGYKEYYYGGDSISVNQKERLTKRVEIINRLYKENRKAKSQTSVTIHLDSRVTKERIDIFFYFKEGSTEGEKLSQTLYSTIKEKYEKVQPGRGYQGNVSSRSLLLLRELKPTATYIELGNIQNKNDQFRFIQKENRQVIAKWLCEGLIKATTKDKHP